MMSGLAPALVDPVLDAQSTFRAVMQAIACPGRIQHLAADIAAPDPLSGAAAALALTLFDYETPVWLDCALAGSAEVVRWLRFHTGAPVTDDPAKATFALVCKADNLPGFEAFAQGTPDYPDRSTTVILKVESLSGGDELILTGPGIDGRQLFAAQPLPDRFVDRMAANRSLYPRGVDLMLVADCAVAAIPRSTRVARGGCACMSQ